MTERPCYGHMVMEGSVKYKEYYVAIPSKVIFPAGLTNVVSN